MLIGFNLAFGPMHILGLKGMPRRYYHYQSGLGWELWNMVATIGAFIIALSVLVFIFNFAQSRKKGEVASEDPWDGRTLEWSISSPPPEYNFEDVPLVKERDDFWHRKYKEDQKGRPIPVPAGGSEEHSPGDHGDEGHGIHLPSPSFYPLIAALGLPIMAYAVIWNSWPLGIIGAIVALSGFYGWVLEPATAEH
jgi:cytochrome c oxidase subunit 1